jgi:hypothetical protein
MRNALLAIGILMLLLWLAGRLLSLLGAALNLLLVAAVVLVVLSALTGRR